MTPICFIDGAHFDSVDGFLTALQRGVIGVPDRDEALSLLFYLFHRSRRAAHPDRTRLHLVWLNSDVSRRRLVGATEGARPDGTRGRCIERRLRGSFSELARSLAAFPGIDLILL